MQGWGAQRRQMQHEQQHTLCSRRTTFLELGGSQHSDAHLEPDDQPFVGLTYPPARMDCGRDGGPSHTELQEAGPGGVLDDEGQGPRRHGLQSGGWAGGSQLSGPGMASEGSWLQVGSR